MSLIKRLSWLPSLLVIAGLMLVASCKEDEKPKSGISFAIPEQEVNESDGVVEVVINISAPLSEKAVIGYTLSGTAEEDVDYAIEPVGGYITIGPGATSFIIEIELGEDGNVEYDFDEEIGFETIIITLDEVVSGPAQLNGELTHTVSVFEDDLLILLFWDGTDVDMDMFAWIDNPDTEPVDYLGFNPSFVGGISVDTEVEYLIIRGGLVEGDYGFSFVYYEGTSDDLTFEAQAINFGGSINGASSELISEGHYTLANINKWDDEATGTDPIIRQTATKSGLNFVDFSEIDLTIPGTSRVKKLSGEITGNPARGESFPIDIIKRIVEQH